MVYTVVLTGGIGSGKTTIANLFMQFGINIIDTDIIARKIVEPGTEFFHAIANHFGSQIINNKGTLNRRLLREIIFSSQNERNWLNILLHPAIYKKSKQCISKATSPYVLWVIPLLIEKKIYKNINRILVVDVTLETQIRRTIIRDNISYNHLKNILHAQNSRKTLLAIADDVIDNNGSLNEIISSVTSLHMKYLLKSHKYNV